MALKGGGRLGCISLRGDGKEGEYKEVVFFYLRKPFVTPALLATTAPTLLRLCVCHFKLVAGVEEGRALPCL